MVGRAQPPTGQRMDALVSPPVLPQKLLRLPSTAASGVPLPSPTLGPTLVDALQRCSSMRFGPQVQGHAGAGAPAKACSSAKESAKGAASVSDWGLR
jgi:hypothetical protein